MNLGSRLHDGRAQAAAVLYVALALGQRAISFLLIPFVAAALRPDEYGTIALLTSFTILLSIGLSLCLETAVFRAVILGESALHRDDVRAVTVYLRWVLPAAGLLLAGLVLLLDLTFLSADRWATASAVISAFWAPAIYALALPTLRAHENLRGFAALSLTSMVAQAALTIGLIVVAGLGLKGWAIANAGAAAIGFAASLWVRVSARGVRARWRGMRAPLELTLPLLPHQLFTWVVGFADRALVVALVGASQAGIYSLAYQMAAVLGLVLTELNRSTMPNYTRMAEADRRDPSWSRLLRGHLGVMLLVTAVAALASPVLDDLVFPPAYRGAQDYVVPLLIAQLAYGLYFIPANILTLTRGRTSTIWIASGVGATANVVVNVALLPSIGAWGAVWATLVAYAAMALTAVTLEHRSPDRILRLPPWPTVALLLLWTAALSSALLDAAVGPWITGVLFLCCAVSAAVLALGGRATAGAPQPAVATEDRPGGATDGH